LEVSIKEIDGLKKYQDEMQKKYEDMEKKAKDAPEVGESSGGGGYEDNLGNYRKARAVGQQSRQSRSSTFF
jgi:hypothetical protein